MASLNRIMLIGGVGKDPEVRQFQDGSQVCNFTLATSESYTDRNGEKKEETTWHNIVLNGKLAGLAQYIHKGSKLYVEGKIRNRSYQTQNGETRYVTEIVGLGLQLLDPKPQQQAATAPQYSQPAPPPAPQRPAYQQAPPAAPGYQQPQPPLPPMNDPSYSQPQDNDLPW